jgi:hypothetical protein
MNTIDSQKINHGDIPEGIYPHVNVAIHDSTQLTYLEVLADEQQASAISFVSRAVAWFNGQGVDCRQVEWDNGLAHVSRRFAK